MIFFVFISITIFIVFVFFSSLSIVVFVVFFDLVIDGVSIIVVDGVIMVQIIFNLVILHVVSESKVIFSFSSFFVNLLSSLAHHVDEGLLADRFLFIVFVFVAIIIFFVVTEIFDDLIIIVLGAFGEEVHDTFEFLGRPGPR